MYKQKTTVEELRQWLAQFEPADTVSIGGTPVSGYILVGKEEKIFALCDDDEDSRKYLEYMAKKSQLLKGQVS